MQCSAMKCSALQYRAEQYSAEQYSAEQYSSVQFSAVQYIAEQYSAQQCSAVQGSGSAVQCSAVQGSGSAVQCSAGKWQCSGSCYPAAHIGILALQGRVGWERGCLHYSGPSNTMSLVVSVIDFDICIKIFNCSSIVI